VTAKKTITGKGQVKKLNLKKETIRELGASDKSKGIKGGMKIPTRNVCTDDPRCITPVITSVGC
jgi:hypothetical protein